MFYSGFIPTVRVYAPASGAIDCRPYLNYDRQPEINEVKCRIDNDHCQQCGDLLTTDYVSVHDTMGHLGNYCWRCAGFIRATQSFLPRATERVLLDNFVKPSESEQKIEPASDAPKSKWET